MGRRQLWITRSEIPLRRQQFTGISGFLAPMCESELVFLGAYLFFATASLAADPPATNAPTVLPMVIVIGTNYGASLTSPPFSQADQKKKEVPGGYTLQGVDPMNLGRVSSLDDFFQDAPGLVTLSENEVEVSKVFIRGSGVYSGTAERCAVSN